MKKLTLILAMSSIVAYGQEDYGTVNLVKCNTEDSVRTIQKASYTFNKDSTVLTYACESKVTEYYAKPIETPKKETPTFLKLFQEALEIFVIVVVVALVILFLLACGL